MSYIKRSEKFLADIDLTEGETSNIWDSLRKDFQIPNTDFRGYGLSTLSDKRRTIYMAGKKIITFPFRSINFLSSRFRTAVLKAWSWTVLEFDPKAAKKFGFDDYEGAIYDERLVELYLGKYTKHGIGLSHNTLKSFHYLETLKSNTQLGDSINVFEIGAGLFNFGHLLTLELTSFEYVICDLPEMVISAHQQITDLYLSNAGGDYEVFLPNEVDLFNASDCSRKILFVTPNQLKENVLGEEKRFDLFVNHESFAEMNLEVVNRYLESVAKLMKVGGTINLVNRHTRPQAKIYADWRNLTLSQITCFSDYDLSFCRTVVKEFDSFRARIPGMQTLPNVFFIGEVKQ